MPAAEEHADVIVVGAGIAGLTAAWALRDRDVVVLEATDRIGGRVRSDTHGDAHYHLGAQYIAGRTCAALLDDLGVPLTRVSAEAALYLDGKRVHGNVLSLARGADIGIADLPGLVGLARQSVAASRHVGDVLDPDREIGADAPEPTELDERSLAELLRHRRPALRRLYAVLVRSLTSSDPSRLSALYALAMLGAEGKDGVGHPHRAPGGMRGVLDAFARALDGRMRTGCPVESVAAADRDVTVTYRDAAARRTVCARACVVAVPAPFARELCGDLPEHVTDSLARVPYARFLTAALFLSEPIWEDGFAIATDLPVVSTMINPSAATGSGRGTVLSAYASDDAARLLWELSDADVTDRFVADISRVFPPVSGRVTGAAVRRWDPGYPAWAPGHRALLPTLVTPHGRTVLAGDYLSIPSIEGAMVSALRAAGAVRSILGAPS